jgi:hypothetical protein
MRKSVQLVGLSHVYISVFASYCNMFVANGAQVQRRGICEAPCNLPLNLSSGSGRNALMNGWIIDLVNKCIEDDVIRVMDILTDDSVGNKSGRSNVHWWKDITNICCGFGGLEDACWPLVPKFAGSNPAEAVGYFRAKKYPARLPSEGK